MLVPYNVELLDSVVIYKMLSDEPQVESISARLLPSFLFDDGVTITQVNSM